MSKSGLKSKRGWIEPGTTRSGAFISGSSYAITVATGEEFTSRGYLDLELSDCSRKITWNFGPPGDKRAKKKIATLKKLVDEIYNYLHEIEDEK